MARWAEFLALIKRAELTAAFPQSQRKKSSSRHSGWLESWITGPVAFMEHPLTVQPTWWAPR